jgi:hypothetical protein
MEQTYWLGRKRASATNARHARSAEARLAHLDLAGRYSVKAAACGPPQPALRLALPQSEPADAAYYGRLEAGAVWLASQTDVDGERREHLGMAARYARLRLDAEPSKGGWDIMRLSPLGCAGAAGDGS